MLMEYMGFKAYVKYDGYDQIFYSRIEGISDGVGFHADTLESLEEAFKQAVEDYIEYTSGVILLPPTPVYKVIILP